MLKALQRSKFGILLDLVSPSFFDVLPARTLWSEGRKLLASLRASDEATTQLSALAEDLETHGVAAEVDDACLTVPVATSDAAARGQRVLQIYFAQLAHGDRALLDLRHERFTASDDRLTWRPTSLACRWSQPFLAGLRDMYAGFYLGKPQRFDAGVQALGLTPAADLMLEHFGPGDQTAVEFDIDRFRTTFHAIFERCRDEGIELSPGFVSLGVYLGALYQHLQSVDVPLDVRGAFESVWLP